MKSYRFFKIFIAFIKKESDSYMQLSIRKEKLLKVGDFVLY